MIMVMDIAGYVKSMLKTDTVSIDNFVFRLHYRVTVAILLASSIIGRTELPEACLKCEGQVWLNSTLEETVPAHSNIARFSR